MNVAEPEDAFDEAHEVHVNRINEFVCRSFFAVFYHRAARAAHKSASWRNSTFAIRRLPQRRLPPGCRTKPASYKKYGLDVSIIYVAGAQAITTLISGDAHIVQGSGAAAALSRLSGSDATVIGTTINVIPMSLVTTPDIATAQDLKGKTFGVSRFGSLTDLGLSKAVSRIGSRPEQRHQDDSNRRRAGDLACSCSRA